MLPFYLVLFLLFFAVLAAGYFYLQRAKARDATTGRGISFRVRGTGLSSGRGARRSRSGDRRRRGGLDGHVRFAVAPGKAAPSGVV